MDDEKKKKTLAQRLYAQKMEDRRGNASGQTRENARQGKRMPLLKRMNSGHS